MSAELKAQEGGAQQRGLVERKTTTLLRMSGCQDVKRSTVGIVIGAKPSLSTKRVLSPGLIITV
jgi:hypothetical protein